MRKVNRAFDGGDEIRRLAPRLRVVSKAHWRHVMNDIDVGKSFAQAVDDGLLAPMTAIRSPGLITCSKRLAAKSLPGTTGEKCR